MFCSRKSNSLVNYFHERALRVVDVNNDHSISYSKLIMAKDDLHIYQHKSKIFTKEMYKFKHDLSLPLINPSSRFGRKP